MEKNKLISLALSFVSFLIPKIEINQVILFGSVASNKFDNESDIDLFVETDEKNQNKIKKLLELYKKTKEYEKFKLEGIKNEISIKLGKLEEWKSLKRSIISNGIVLYGKYKGQPDNLIHKLIFILDLKKIPRSKKMKIWRKIYGYKQKIGKKIYTSDGVIDKKIGRGAFIINHEKSEKLQEYLNKNKIQYSLMDIWLE